MSIQAIASSEQPASASHAPRAMRPSPSLPSSPNEPLLLGIVLALTALVYSPALRFAFVFDDHWQLIENQWVQAWRFVPGYFAGHVWQHLGAKPPDNYYRPLNFLWYRVNDALFGLNPAGWHGAAILLHVLATYLAYQVARRLTGRSLVAAAAALVFGIHPMRHDVVGWVSGTTESLYAVLLFAAFLAYLRSREAGHRGLWTLLSCASYGLALLSKEPAILLPLIVFAHACLYGRRAAEDSGAPQQSQHDQPSRPPQPPLSRRLLDAARIALAYLPVAVAYLAVRSSILHGFSHPKVEVTARTLVFSVPSIAWFYMRQWLLPNRMSEFYETPLQSHFNAAHVLLPVLALAALALILWLVRNKLGWREVAFALVWMCAFLLPVFDLGVFPQGDIVHDRYFYVPSFGAALLLALALDRLSRGKLLFGIPRRWLLATAALLALLSYGTVNAMSYWASDFQMLDHAMHYSPNDPILRNHYSVGLALLGRASYERHDWPAAETYLQRAAKIDPEAADNYLQLGMVDLNTGRSAEAESNFRTAVALRPAEPMYRFALGIALQNQHNCAAAVAQFTEALALKPGFASAQQQIDACRATAQQSSRQASGQNAVTSLAKPAQAAP
jgi:tetratricopeptide (TPR) repeat protein